MSGDDSHTITPHALHGRAPVALSAVLHSCVENVKQKPIKLYHKLAVHV